MLHVPVEHSGSTTQNTFYVPGTQGPGKVAFMHLK